MPTIGTFTRQEDKFAGTVATLTLKAKVTITPVAKTSETAPDYRVYAGAAEIGAAWAQTSKAGRAYLSVRLDDPSFAAPVMCALIENGKGHNLIWNR